MNKPMPNRKKKKELSKHRQKQAKNLQQRREVQDDQRAWDILHPKTRLAETG